MYRLTGRDKDSNSKGFQRLEIETAEEDTREHRNGGSGPAAAVVCHHSMSVEKAAPRHFSRRNFEAVRPKKSRASFRWNWLHKQTHGKKMALRKSSCHLFGDPVVPEPPSRKCKMELATSLLALRLSWIPLEELHQFTKQDRVTDLHNASAKKLNHSGERQVGRTGPRCCREHLRKYNTPSEDV